MKYLISLFCAIFMLSSVQAEVVDGDPALAVASLYFDALVTGKLEVADSLVAAPYSLGFMPLKSIKDVKAAHRSMLEKRGPRETPEYVVSRVREADDIVAENIGSEYETIRFKLKGEEHSGSKIDFFIKKMGEEYKVVGFWD